MEQPTVSPLTEKSHAVRALLQRVLEEHRDVVLASSLGAEDMVLTDIIARHVPGIRIFMLDTGRLHEETYALLQQVQERYDVGVDIYYPDTSALERFVREQGINAFYGSIGARKTCCGIRKVEPLRRALAGRGAWVTGLRRAQAVTRSELPEIEWDEANGLVKVNPLAQWTEDDVWRYLRAEQVPYNALHDRGFPSIGCAPCTRAITPGEDIRAGRWWWEDPDSKECGLHPGRATGQG